jgi:hypothetical protein
MNDVQFEVEILPHAINSDVFHVAAPDQEQALSLAETKYFEARRRFGMPLIRPESAVVRLAGSVTEDVYNLSAGKWRWTDSNVNLPRQD